MGFCLRTNDWEGNPGPVEIRHRVAKDLRSIAVSVEGREDISKKDRACRRTQSKIDDHTWHFSAE